MKTPQNKTKFSLYLSYSILALIFAVDCFVHFGIMGGVPYVIGLIVLMWLLKPEEVLWFSATCGVLTVVAFVLGEDVSQMSGLMNRFMAIFTMVAIAMLIKRHTEDEDRHKEAMKHLNSVVDKRTEGLKQVVDQLEEQKIRLAESEELGHFGFWEYHPSTQQMVWSNGVFAIYGFPITPQAPSMQEFLDQCHTDDAQTLQRSIQYGLAEKKPYTVEYRLIMPDGSLKWIFNRGRPIVNKQGTVELLVGTIQDVTNQKHSQDSVHANRARYTTLFKSAAVAKVLMIPNKRILEANTAFSRWIGYSEKKLLKVPLEKLIHEDDRSMDNAYAREMITGDIEFYQKEKRFIRSDGTILWGLFSVSPVHDAEDKITCFAVEIIDITGHKNLQLALQKAQESWQEAEEALTESEAARRLAETTLAESEAARRHAEEKLERRLVEARQQGSSMRQSGGGMQREEFTAFEADTASLHASGDSSPSLQDPMPASMDDNIEYFEEPKEKPVLGHNGKDDAYSEDRSDMYFAEQGGDELAYARDRLNPASRSEENYGEEELPESPSEIRGGIRSDLRSEFSQDSELVRDTRAAALSEAPVEPPAAGRQVVPDEPPHRDSDSASGPGMSEEFIDNLFQLSNDLLAIMGLDGCYRRVSPALSSELGFQDGEMDDQHFLNFVHQEDREEIQDLLRKVQQGGKILKQPLRHVSKFDGYRRFLWDASVNEEQGVIYSVLKPAFEIPDFAAETRPAAPQVSEETVVASPEPAITPEPEPIPEPEPPPAQVAAPRSEPPPAQVAAPRSEYTPAPEPAPAEPRPEPQRVQAQTPVSVPKPRPKAQKQVDWRRLTDRMPFQIWMLGTDQSCRYVNKKVRDFTGLPFEQLEGRGWSKTVHPEDYRKYVAYYQEVFQQWKPMGCIYRLRRNDGIYRWMQESSVPIFKRDGSVDGYLVTCMEISSLQSVETKFSDAFKKAVNLLDIKSAIFPCQKEDSQLALADGVKIADALISNAGEVPNAELAQLMEYAGLRLLQLIRDTLGFVQADIHDHQLLKRSISLSDVIESTIEMLTPLRRGEGPRFRFERSERDIRVMVDKVLVHRLFENVLRILLEWAESRVITVDIVEGQDMGIVEIKHLGPVIEQHFLNQLDVNYRQGASTQLQKKAGLELSLIKRLAEAMDGGMLVREDKEIGPIIELYFGLAEQVDAEETVPVVDEALRGESPVEPAHLKQLNEVVEAIASLEAPPPALVVDENIPDEEEILVHENGVNGKTISRHRVLVGETNSETQRLVRSLLQPYYDLTIVPNTDDLLKQAEASQFDLLLLDVHLQGGQSGVDVLRELRRRPQYTRTPAIAVAASSSAIDQRELIDRAGFDGFLRKPYSIVELLETVERMIET